MTQAFVERLSEFAETVDVPQLTGVIARVRQPTRVAVRGRRGVGRGTVAQALRLAGRTVTNAEVADVVVLVIAEAPKPEELLVLRAAGRSALIVLTKADLSGAGVGGPLGVARRRAEAIRARTGTPTVALAGLLAACDRLDGAEVEALQAFVRVAPDLSSVDAFVDQDHPVRREVRVRLGEGLDRFGIAHAVLALAGGRDPAELPLHLRRLSNVAEVMTALDATAAPVRYRRLRVAVTELACLAVQLNDDRLARFLAEDDVVLAEMAAAVDVVEAAGLVVNRGDDRAAHVDRARRWRRYGGGPVDALHRSCGEDIVRGSLRLVRLSE